eukprot:CAMPEP_0170522698 /NCGR_PEP_ID=MMETSP0209-20121228/8122_1 /TAXON_ID=665100 ORGANISM="Litonotus pictus, Strain P1" /NCGR_SAMPLE_ID=MMETSP0209 /ASSEMBLY_ACC=CAM_ASM_000301 /LENGTH=491 /DNA_ID=CAMNT_0010810343 /DNA_START=50 /DNA_END=1526 /DNA_ORIENTATION=+
MSSQKNGGHIPKKNKKSEVLYDKHLERMRKESMNSIENENYQQQYKYNQIQTNLHSTRQQQTHQHSNIDPYSKNQHNSRYQQQYINNPHPKSNLIGSKSNSPFYIPTPNYNETTNENTQIKRPDYKNEKFPHGHNKHIQDRTPEAIDEDKNSSGYIEITESIAKIINVENSSSNAERDGRESSDNHYVKITSIDSSKIKELLANTNTSSQVKAQIIEEALNKHNSNKYNSKRVQNTNPSNKNLVAADSHMETDNFTFNMDLNKSKLKGNKDGFVIESTEKQHHRNENNLYIKNRNKLSENEEVIFNQKSKEKPVKLFLKVEEAHSKDRKEEGKNKARYQHLEEEADSSKFKKKKVKGNKEGGYTDDETKKQLKIIKEKKKERSKSNKNQSKSKKKKEEREYEREKLRQDSNLEEEYYSGASSDEKTEDANGKKIKYMKKKEKDQLEVKGNSNYFYIEEAIQNKKKEKRVPLTACSLCYSNLDHNYVSKRTV